MSRYNISSVILLRSRVAPCMEWDNKKMPPSGINSPPAPLIAKIVIVHSFSFPFQALNSNFHCVSMALFLSSLLLALFHCKFVY